MTITLVACTHCHSGLLRVLHSDGHGPHQAHHCLCHCIEGDHLHQVGYAGVGQSLRVLHAGGHGHQADMVTRQTWSPGSHGHHQTH